MAVKSVILVNNSLKTMAIMTLMTSLVWTFVAVYNAIDKPGKVEVSAELLKPVEVNLDTAVLDEIAGKRRILEESSTASILARVSELAKEKQQGESTPTPTNTQPPPTATSSGSL